MVGTIIHVVNVDRAAGRKSLVFWIHIGAYLAGSALLGGLLGLLGLGIRTPARWQPRSSDVLLMIGIVGVLYSLRELELIRVPAPKVSRQVPSRWRLTMPPKRLAFFYGFELGIGLTTYVTATTFYVVVLWAFLVASPWLGALGMMAYGVGRAFPMLWLGTKSTPNGREALIDRLQPWSPVVHYVNGLILGFAGASLFTAAWLNR